MHHKLLTAAGVLAGILLAVSCAGNGRAAEREKRPSAQPATEIGPVEDMMREHGVLRRLCLIYEDCALRLQAGAELRPETLRSAADLVRTFIEDYHEKLEEEYVFSRFGKDAPMGQLSATLREQHEAGRKLTKEIHRLATPEALKDAARRAELSADIRQFIRMYRPHAAREDTVLFPAFHELLAPAAYGALGEAFEDREHALFGERGFEGIVSQVEALERTLGIYDISQFTAAM